MGNGLIRRLTIQLGVLHKRLVGQHSLIGAVSVSRHANFYNSNGTEVVNKLDTFAAGWHGGLKNAEQFVGNSTLRAAISSAMLFWFDNDFTDPSCLDYGGTDLCPCSTPGLWNTNWDSNVSYFFLV